MNDDTCHTYQPIFYFTEFQLYSKRDILKCIVIMQALQAEKREVSAIKIVTRHKLLTKISTVFTTSNNFDKPDVTLKMLGKRFENVFCIPNCLNEHSQFITNHNH